MALFESTMLQAMGYLSTQYHRKKESASVGKRGGTAVAHRAVKSGAILAWKIA